MFHKIITKTRGAIAVFLSLIMLGMTVFECMLIDASRVIAAKTVISGAGDLALNSALTNYDQVLYEVYGLFATAKDEADLENKIENYFNRTIQGAGIDGSVDDVHNLLNLFIEDGSLNLEPAQGSALSNSDVMEQQILEYMKFRGPVNIGLGLLEKIKAFGDFNKQTEAMEAQLDFEEKLDSLQKSCENVYKRANDLKNWHSQGNDINDFFLNNNAWSDINAKIGEFERHIVSVAEFKDYRLLNSNHETMDITDEPTKYNANKRTNWVWNTTAEYKEHYNIDLLMKIINRMHPIGLISDSSNASTQYVNAFNQLFDDCNYLYESYYGNLDGFKNALDNYRNHIQNNAERLQEFYALANHYVTWFWTVGYYDTDEEARALNIDFYNCYVNTIEYYRRTIEFCSFESMWDCADGSGYVNLYEYKVKAVYQSIYEELSWRKAAAQTVKIKAQDLKKAIDCGSHTGNTENYCCLANAAEKTKTEKQKWKNKIDALPEGNTKTSMQGTFESEASGIEASAYTPMLQMAEKLETFFDEYVQYIDSIKIINGFGNEKIIADTPSYYLNWTQILNGALTVKKNGGTSYDCIRILGSMPYNPLSGTITQVMENDNFYKYLSQICAESEKTEESQNKKDAQETKKNLFETGNDNSKKEADSAQLGSLSASEWTELEKSVADGVGEGDAGAENTGVGYSDNNKTASKNAKNSLKNTSSFLSGIESVLVNARNNLYLTEYAVGMFSCYTTGRKDANDVYTIAGKNDAYHKLCTQYNKLYRSEQEYILWGKHKQQNNVNYTLMMIFGIRLALNMVYAFTGDAEINAVTLAWATAIAGWTGFGVPLVQSVLKIALAMAESAYDVMLLMDGEDVVLYKTSATWVMKPSNMTKGVINNVAGKLEEAARSTVDSAFNYVDQAAADKIDQVTNSVSDTVEEIEKSAVEAAVSTILSPFEKQLITLSSTVNISDAEIETKVNSVFNSIYQEAKANQTALGQLEVYILDNCKSALISSFTSQAKSLRDSASKALDTVSIENIKNTLIQKANASDIVKKLGNEVKTTVSEKLQTVNEQTQEAVGNFVSEQVTGLLNKVQGSGGSGGAMGSVTGGFAITMNYKEYVHIFLLLKSVINHDAYLTRIGHLIQLNMTTRNGDFKLNEAYTLLQLNAVVKVNTTFLGKLDSFLENPVGGKSEYKLIYHGLQGY